MTPIWLKKLVVAGVMVGLLYTVQFAVNIAEADLAFFRAEKSFALFRADRNKQDSKYLKSARKAIDIALNHWRDDPRYLSLAAQIHVWEGYLQAAETNSPEIEIRHYSEATELLREALRLAPAHAKTWALLAEYKARAGQKDQEWHNAREKALELGGGDIQLVNRMLAL